MWEHAAIGPIPGQTVLLCGFLFHSGLLAFAVFTLKGQRVVGRVECPATLRRSFLVVHHLGPDGASLRTANCGRHKQHSFHSILHGGKIAIVWNRLAVDLRINCSRSFQIDIGKSLQKTFRMTSGNPSETLCDLANISIAAPINTPRRVGILHDQIIWIFLQPLERSLGPIDPDS